MPIWSASLSPSRLLGSVIAVMAAICMAVSAMSLPTELRLEMAMAMAVVTSPVPIATDMRSCVWLASAWPIS